MRHAVLVGLLLALAGCANSAAPGSGPDSDAAKSPSGSSQPAPLQAPHTNPKMDGPPGG